MMFRRTLLVTAAAFAGASTLPAAAQEWPARQVTIVVPFTAGGTTDLFARIFANAMQAKYNQPFVVENKGGAGGTIGAASAAKAANDGYTLFVGTGSTHAIAPFVYKRPGYDADKDFQPDQPLRHRARHADRVQPKLPVKDFKEFVAYVKANDGKLSYGSSGVGSANHLPAEVLAKLIGAKMTHVPYRSSNEIMNGDRRWPYRHGLRQHHLRLAAVAGRHRKGDGGDHQGAQRDARRTCRPSARPTPATIWAPGTA